MKFIIAIVLVLIMIFLIMIKKFYGFVGEFHIPMDFAWPFFGQSFPFLFKPLSKIFEAGIEGVIRHGGTAVFIIGFNGGTAVFIIGFNANVWITDPEYI